MNNNKDFVKKINHAIDNNIAPNYMWYHSENDDGNIYVPRKNNYFKTRYECLDDIRKWREDIMSFCEDFEKMFKITYTIRHCVLSQYDENGIFSSGVIANDEHFVPNDFDN